MEIKKRTEESNVFVVLSQAWSFLIEALRQIFKPQKQQAAF